MDKFATTQVEEILEQPVLLRVSTSYMGLGGSGGLRSLMLCCSFFSISVAKLSISFDCSVVSCKRRWICWNNITSGYAGLLSGSAYGLLNGYTDGGDELPQGVLCINTKSMYDSLNTRS
jgi:hypothetical protein